MQPLLTLAEQVAARLRARGETVAVAESSAGGLIAAALLAQPGASAYFLGGAVVYTKQARAALLGITPEDMQGIRSASERSSLMCSACAQTSGMADPLGWPRTSSRSGMSALSQTCSGISAPRLVQASIVSSNAAACARSPSASA